ELPVGDSGRSAAGAGARNAMHTGACGLGGCGLGGSGTRGGGRARARVRPRARLARARLVEHGLSFAPVPGAARLRLDRGGDAGATRDAPAPTRLARRPADRARARALRGRPAGELAERAGTRADGGYRRRRLVPARSELAARARL